MKLPANPDVLIIGAGPAGLAAARVLASHGKREIVIVDRDEEPGGLPRYCSHPGFGWEYSRRLESGTAFARRMRRAVPETGTTLLAATTALRIEPGPMVELVGEAVGHAVVQPRAVLLATGIREAPRPARLVPGARPERGILTTGHLQQLVSRNVAMPFRRMLVVGTEHVSFSALLTGRHAGIGTVAMVEEAERVASFPVAAAAARYLLGVRICLDSTVTDILGRETVRCAVLRCRGEEKTIDCDAIVFTGGWRPEAVLARESAIGIDPGSGGPVIDQMMRTTMPGVFAAGNVLRGVESSGAAALEGARAGACIAAFLREQISGRLGAVHLSTSAPLRYIVPQRWSLDDHVRITPSMRCSTRAIRDARDTSMALRSQKKGWPLDRRRRLRRERQIPLALEEAFANLVPDEDSLRVELTESDPPPGQRR